jgi:predicted transcriptional regulator
VVPAAIDIRKAVFSDHLVCLEDGKTFKTLTRYLGETHGMTPERYRAKWDLPESYRLITPSMHNAAWRWPGRSVSADALSRHRHRQ